MTYEEYRAELGKLIGSAEPAHRDLLPDILSQAEMLLSRQFVVLADLNTEGTDHEAYRRVR